MICFSGRFCLLRFVVDHLIAKNLPLIFASAEHCHSSVAWNFPPSPNDIRAHTADYCWVDIGAFRSIRTQHKRGLSKSSIGASSSAGTRSPLPVLVQDSYEIVFPSPYCMGIWAQLDLCIGWKSECLILLSSPFLFFFRRQLFALSVC